MSILDKLSDVGILLRRPRTGENRSACPRCDRGDRDDALAVRLDGDRAVWVCHRCRWTGGTDDERAVRERRPAVSRPVPPARERSDVRRVAYAIWNAAAPLSGTAGADYLRRRGCIVPEDDGDLRFAPKLFCAKVGRELPAIVCRVSTVIGNRGVGVHRIFLDPAETDRAAAKMRLGGADQPVCIRLFHDEDVTYSLALAEGVETGLAAARLHSPIWSTIDAGGMTRFPVLDGIETLVVFGDHDDAGIKAAGACVDQWRDAGKNVVAVAPARPGDDLNDVVLEVTHG